MTPRGSLSFSILTYRGIKFLGGYLEKVTPKTSGRSRDHEEEKGDHGEEGDNGEEKGDHGEDGDHEEEDHEGVGVMRELWAATRVCLNLHIA